MQSASLQASQVYTAHGSGLRDLQGVFSLLFFLSMRQTLSTVRSWQNSVPIAYKKIKTSNTRGRQKTCSPAICSQPAGHSSPGLSLLLDSNTNKPGGKRRGPFSVTFPKTLLIEECVLWRDIALQVCRNEVLRISYGRGKEKRIGDNIHIGSAPQGLLKRNGKH